MATPGAQKEAGPLASNRKARHDFEILSHLEAGIALLGTEVKSIRAGQANLLGSYARVDNGQVWVHHLNIMPYECGNRFNHEPERPRRLLLHRNEIRRLASLVDQQGQVLVPLSLYLKQGHIKLDLGICRGKTHGDRRETLKRRTSERETQRAIAFRK